MKAKTLYLIFAAQVGLVLSVIAFKLYLVYLVISALIKYIG